MKKTILIFLLSSLIITTFSQIPTGYYDDAEGLTGDNLKAALHTIIKTGHIKFPYTSGSTDVWDILKETDKDPNNSSNVILIYKGISIDAAQEYNNGNGWTREHVWAKSHGFPDDSDYGYTDVHHLRPCDNSVNTDRGTKDFDNGGTPHDEATECNYDSDSWEPRDAVKGDVARMMFYMAVRYEGDGGSGDDYDLELVDYTGTSGTNFGKLTTLLAWHTQDPVDDWERNRNNIIYNDYQKNRNPFIDRPEFVEYIWGTGVPENPIITNVEYSPTEPAPETAISVTANVTDNGTVSNVKLIWGNDGTTFPNTIVMSVTSGSEYATSNPIPGQTDGTTISFKIEATDDEANTSVTGITTIEITNSTEIISEDFSVCPLTVAMPEWTSYSISGNKDWECEIGAISANAYGGDAPSQDWLITPSLNLNNYVDEILKFDSYTKYTDTFYPTLEVKYSTNYSGSGNPEDATWTDLSPILSAEGSETSTSSGDVDLSGIAGSTVYIGFVYTSSGNAANTCAYWKIDNVVVTGIEEDANAPTFISGYPITDNLTEIGFDIKVKINEPGKVYYVILEEGTDAPSIAEVKLESLITVTSGNVEYPVTIDNLTHSTSYDIYFVAEDDEPTPNVQTTLTKITVSTLEVDIDPPVFITDYPEVRNIGGTSLDVYVKLDEIGKVYYKLVDDNATAPTINELKTADTIIIQDENSEYFATISDLTPETNYDIYLIAEDDEIVPNIQTAVTKIDVTTGEQDLIPPQFITGFPVIDSIKARSAFLQVQLDEKGYFYYLLKPASDSEPTIDEIKAGTSMNINLAYTTYEKEITSLSPETAYKIYQVASDDETEANFQETFTTLSFATTGLPPSITQQPISQTICEGDAAEFTVTGSSNSEIQYQWYKNNEIIVGDTLNNLSFTNTTISNAGNYFCALTNQFSTQNTDTVLLTVNEEVFAGADTNFLVCADVDSINLFDYLIGANQHGVFFDNSQTGALSRNIFYINQVEIGSYNFTYYVDGEACDDDYAVINVTIDECTGIGNKEIINLSLYFDYNGYLNIDSDINLNSVNIFNIYGQEIISKKSIQLGKTNLIENDLKGGIYIVRINTNKGIQTFKVFKSF
jgi:endonuclease I